MNGSPALWPWYFMRWCWREFFSARRRCQALALSGRQCHETAVTSGKPAFCAEHKHLA